MGRQRKGRRTTHSILWPEYYTHTYAETQPSTHSIISSAENYKRKWFQFLDTLQQADVAKTGCNRTDLIMAAVYLMYSVRFTRHYLKHGSTYVMPLTYQQLPLANLNNQEVDGLIGIIIFTRKALLSRYYSCQSRPPCRMISFKNFNQVLLKGDSCSLVKALYIVKQLNNQ